jgi:calcineurin-like phosphoesterase family protein
MEKIFFISDTHFSHRNVLHYDSRPWTDIRQHDDDLVDKWNSKVDKSDTVYHLGDFALAGRQRQNDLIQRLNGKIYLVLGNHDKKHLVGVEYFVPKRTSEPDLVINEKRIKISHYPFDLVMDLSYTDVYLFGHSHINGPHVSYIKDLNGVQIIAYNMYCGYWDFEPKTLEEILEVKYAI